MSDEAMHFSALSSSFYNIGHVSLMIRQNERISHGMFQLAFLLSLLEDDMLNFPFLGGSGVMKIV